MTDFVIAASVETTLGSAKRTMEKRAVRHLPVIGDERVIGILSLRELASAASIASHFAAERDAYESFLQSPVGDFLKTRFSADADVIVVEPGAPLAAAIDLLVDRRLSALPVVDANDGLVGIVSYIDILEALRDTVG
jgi:CBS domain-containing protein